MDCRILSFQSHVVSGYVGNKAAIFPLQLLGFDVDFINSVQFSNHTGYPLLKGPSITTEQLDDIVQGLHANQLDNYDYLLTGFINSEETLLYILQMLTQLKTVNAKIKYVCDPVFGDNGNYYVHPTLVPIFIEKILPQAYMITPNQFEAELLSGRPIATESDCIDCLRALHSVGPSLVVITSVELKSEPENLYSYILDASDPSMPPCISKIAFKKLHGKFFLSHIIMNLVVYP